MEDVATFPTKVDTWLAALVAAALLIPLELMVVLAIIAPAELSASMPILIASLLFSGGMVFLVAWPVHYTVTEEDLLIRFGIFKRRVPLATIIGISQSRDPTSSPAWSLDRLRVEYLTPTNKTRAVLVSPADKAGFLAALSASPLMR